MQGRCKNLSTIESYQMMDKLIDPNHILRKVDANIDFSFVDKETESLFSPNRGRKSVPPQQYFKMLLLKHLFGITSNRKLVEALQYNIVYRWFCGFTLEDKVPDQSIFSKMKKRFGSDTFARFFNSILQQCIDNGLVKSNSVMTDSTLFTANASLDSMHRLDGTGQKKRGEKLSNKTHKSITDPDATLAYKSGTPRTLKYKAHVCSDSESRVIVHMKITTGAIHDSVPYLNQIKQINDFGLKINETIADSAYGSADILIELNKRAIDANIPLFSSRSGSEKSSSQLKGFSYREDKNEYICPNNKTLKACNAKSDTILFISKASDCQTCPLSTECAAKIRNKFGSRVVSRNKHADLFKEVRAKMELSKFKEKLYQRLWMLEGIMNELKNYHGLNRAHYRGLENVSIQGYMAAIAINIKRIISFGLWVLWLILFLF